MLVEIISSKTELIELDVRSAPLYFDDGYNLYKMDDKSILQVTERMVVEWPCDTSVYKSLAGRYAKGEFKVAGKSEFDLLLIKQSFQFSQHLEA